MRLSQISENILPLFNLRKTIHLLSGPGQGKSSEVEGVWTKLLTEQTGEKTIAVTIHGTTIEAPDVRGFAIPVKAHDEDCNVTGVITKYAS